VDEFSKIFKPEVTEQTEVAKEAFKEKYYAFQKLLKTNNQVLGPSSTVKG